MVKCKLGGDHRAGGVAGDVGAGHSQMVEDRRRVGGMVCDADRRRGVGAADPAPLVISDQLVPVGQRRFGKGGRNPSARTGLMNSTGSPPA